MPNSITKPTTHQRNMRKLRGLLMQLDRYAFARGMEMMKSRTGNHLSGEADAARERYNAAGQKCIDTRHEIETLLDELM